jgi:Cu+-exporting ATPase
MKVRSIMVTGDNWGTANSIAKEIGIETVIAEAKPEEKAEKVKELQVHLCTLQPLFSQDLVSCESCFQSL